MSVVKGDGSGKHKKLHETATVNKIIQITKEVCKMVGCQKCRIVVKYCDGLVCVCVEK